MPMLVIIARDNFIAVITNRPSKIFRGFLTLIIVFLVLLVVLVFSDDI